MSGTKTTPDLEALLTGPRRRQHRTFSPEIAAARRKELQRRMSSAQNLARTAPVRLYSDDYRALYEQAAERVANEAGPLPGDEPS